MVTAVTMRTRQEHRPAVLGIRANTRVMPDAVVAGSDGPAR